MTLRPTLSDLVLWIGTQINTSYIWKLSCPCFNTREQCQDQRRSWIVSLRSWCMTWIIRPQRNTLVWWLIHALKNNESVVNFINFKGSYWHLLHHLFHSVSLSGRCARCGDNVLGDGSGCIAMEQVFHVECFTCITCHAQLRGKPFYALDKKSYCESCYIVSLNFFFFFLTLHIFFVCFSLTFHI